VLPLALACACQASLVTPHEGTDARTSNNSDGGNSITPDASTIDAPPACSNGRVVYLNFDGVTLAQANASDAPTNTAAWLGVASVAIPPFQQNATNRAGLISQVTSKVTSGLSQFPITVVSTRPATAPFVMIVFGGTPALVNTRFIDAVMTLDCGDVVKSDVGIVFDNWSPMTTQKAADYAIGAVAYGLGLTGTHDTADCMCGWNNGCQPNAGPCTLSPSITADLACSGETNPQNEVAAFHTAFCQ